MHHAVHHVGWFIVHGAVDGLNATALIDRNVPIIAIAPSGPLFEKTASNVQEAAARGGQVIVMGSKIMHASSGTRWCCELDPDIILHRRVFLVFEAARRREARCLRGAASRTGPSR